MHALHGYIKRVVFGFPEVYTGRMRFWKIWDMVQKMHEEGVDDDVSQQRDDILNI